MDYALDDMPDELAARVRAATGEPAFLAIRHAGEWVVEALTGDRATVMRLSLADDDRVTETTESFVLSAVDAVDPGADAAVTFTRPEGRRTRVPVSETFADVLVAAGAG